jgi:hypothetical protein
LIGSVSQRLLPQMAGHPIKRVSWLRPSDGGVAPRRNNTKVRLFARRSDLSRTEPYSIGLFEETLFSAAMARIPWHGTFLGSLNPTDWRKQYEYAMEKIHDASVVAVSPTEGMLIGSGGVP